MSLGRLEGVLAGEALPPGRLQDSQGYVGGRLAETYRSTVPFLGCFDDREVTISK